jgi:hypothetical protein
MKKFSEMKRAVELLTQPFFEYIMHRAVVDLDYQVENNDIDLAWLLDNKKDISKIETYLGHMQLRRMFDDSLLKNIYKPATYANRKSMTKKMTIPMRNCLEPLNIS